METDKLSDQGTDLPKNPTQQFSRHVSVPSDEGFRVDKVVTIERPVSDVYAFWRTLENLPRFMRHLEYVTVKDDLHSHWAVRTVGEKIFEWDAEIIEQRPNEMISWRSLPGSDIDNAGSVWFTPTPGGNATVVRVSLKYSPPNGKAGALVAKFLGRDAKAEIEEDLNRLKTLLETGEPPEEPTAIRLQRSAVEATRKAGERADVYVRQNPWLFVGSMAAFGLILGILLGLRWRRAPELQNCSNIED